MAKMRGRGAIVVLAGLLVTGARARAEAPAPRAWKPLRSASATATSFLQNDWNRYEENYHPSYVLDENPATAWVEGASGFGEHEAITLPLSPVRRARAVRLTIWNGYQKSMHLWTKNAMPRKVGITVLDAKGGEVVSSERELARVFGPQEVVVELPQGRGLAAVRLTIVSVYEGLKYDDTCISDILVDVDSDVPYNLAAENAKHAALMTWVAGRKATAAYFASKPREFPFAFTKYTEKKTTLDRDEFKRRFAERDAIVKTLGPATFKAAANAPLRALPDGFGDDLRHTEDFVELMKVDQVGLLDTTEAVASHRTLQEGMEEIWTSAARVARDAETNKDVRALAFDVRDVVTERTTSTDKRDLLLVYDRQGRLATLYRKIESNDEEPGDDYDTLDKTDEIWTFTYGATGKVETIERVALQRSQRVYGEKDPGRVLYIPRGRASSGKARQGSRDDGKRAGRERENRRATRLVLTGVPDKSS